jgi:hypothetical protein
MWAYPASPFKKRRSISGYSPSSSAVLRDPTSRTTASRDDRFCRWWPSLRPALNPALSPGQTQQVHPEVGEPRGIAQTLASSLRTGCVKGLGIPATGNGLHSLQINSLAHRCTPRKLINISSEFRYLFSSITAVKPMLLRFGARRSHELSDSSEHPADVIVVILIRCE